MEKNRDYFGRCLELLAIYDQGSQSWKMSQISLFADCQQYAERLPKSGIMRNGKLYQRPCLAHPIYEKDFFLLPTPTKSRYGSNKSTTPGSKRRYSLDMMLTKRLPTPMATDIKSPTDSLSRFSMSRYINSKYNR